MKVIKKKILFIFLFVFVFLFFGSVSLFAAENNVSNVFWTFDPIVEGVDFGSGEYNNLDYDLIYLFIYNDNIGPDSRLGFVIYPVTSAQDLTYYWTTTVYLELGLENFPNGYNIYIIDAVGVGWSYSLYGITFTDRIGDYAIGYKNGRNHMYHDIYNDGFIGHTDIDNPYTSDYGGFNYDLGYQSGYNEGISADTSGNFAALLISIFSAFGTLLAIELIPNITIGMVIGFPIVFGLIYFILGKRKGD